MGIYGLNLVMYDSSTKFYFSGSSRRFIVDVYNGNDIHFINSETGEPFDFPGLWVIDLENPLKYGDVLRPLIQSGNDKDSILSLSQNHLLHRGQNATLSRITVVDNKVISVYGVSKLSGNICDIYKVFRCPKDRIPGYLLGLDFSDLALDSLYGVHETNGVCISYKYAKHGLYEINNDVVSLILHPPKPGPSDLSYYSYTLNNLFDNKKYCNIQKLYQNNFKHYQSGIHLNQDKVVFNDYDSLYRIPLHEIDLKTIQHFISKPELIVNTEGLDSSLEHDKLELFDGNIIVTTLKEKTLIRRAKTKQSRDVSVLQSYLLSIYTSIVLLNDLKLPEGCYLNAFNFIYQYNFWSNCYKAFSIGGLTPEFYNINPEDLTRGLTRLVTDYKNGDAKISQTGGKFTPITGTIYYKIVTENSIVNWLVSLDPPTNPYLAYGGLARSSKSGIDINNKTLNLNYLLSLIYSKGFERSDRRCIGGYWGDTGDYLDILRKDTLSFHDMNILPKQSRLDYLSIYKNRLSKYTGTFSVNIREIYTLSDQSLALLDTGFKSFDTLPDLCVWWVSMLPLFKQIINVEKYTEHELKCLHVLLDTTAIILTGLIEQLQED